RQERGTHVVVERSGSRTLRVHVLPEVVLYAIGRVEDDADTVGRPRRHHAQRGVSAQPCLPPHVLEIGERAVAVVRIGAPEVLRRGGGQRATAGGSVKAAPGGVSMQLTR